MRYIYSAIMYLLTPYLLLRLWWKGRRLPAYKKRIGERFSIGVISSKEYDVWIHAVSLGEVIAATPLIAKLVEQQKKILITTMTPTGAERVKRQFNNQIEHRYIPYELPFAIRRFFQMFKPRTAVIFETELWPNLIYYANQAKIPIYLMNARLSEQSFKGYLKIRYFIKPILQLFTGIYPQNDEDAERFIMLGADPSHVEVLGNIKFDLQLKQDQGTEFKPLKERWGENRTILILASTHDNEEFQILSTLRKLQGAIPGMLVLIAPRHPERFQKVYALSQQMGFNTGLKTNLTSLNPDNDVVVLDTLGELLSGYRLSDYAFVGGSLVPIGGHNVLEPIAMGVPVFSGEFVHNFKSICNDLMSKNAMIMINNAENLINQVIELHQNKTRRKTQICAATKILEANKGTLQKYLQILT